ncbi:hypothetical protein PR202_gb18176 [Eleusine coracana subsp. coracana]|uniref:Uncharacterized protein n=1 Tax=Eleusine coracana subsp. coracana TaxID=191504 RepID=A0AAV5F4W9_ELECO|nr:hypothetical protein PR202_gb18176 [Eleusine coracana subsp. coracana]
MPSPSPGIPRRRSPPAITSLLSRLRAAAGATSPQRLLFQTLALVLTSGLSSSHPAVSSRLLNSLLPHVDRHRLPALLRLLPRDHLTLLLLSAKHHVRSLPLRAPSPAASALHAIAVSSGHLPADLRLANSLLSLYPLPRLPFLRPPFPRRHPPPRHRHLEHPPPRLPPHGPPPRRAPPVR